jgi:hypothetical protein
VGEKTHLNASEGVVVLDGVVVQVQVGLRVKGDMENFFVYIALYLGLGVLIWLFAVLQGLYNRAVEAKLQIKLLDENMEQFRKQYLEEHPNPDEEQIRYLEYVLSEQAAKRARNAAPPLTGRGETPSLVIIPFWPFIVVAVLLDGVAYLGRGAKRALWNLFLRLV